MFEQAGIAIRDEKDYAQLHSLVDAAFNARDVSASLDRVTSARGCGFAISKGFLNAGYWAKRQSRSIRRFLFQTRA